jgi:hypothetical protein
MSGGHKSAVLARLSAELATVHREKLIAECVFDITWQAIQTGIHRLYADSREFFDAIHVCAMEYANAAPRDYDNGPSYLELIEDHAIAFFKRKGKL